VLCCYAERTKLTASRSKPRKPPRMHAVAEKMSNDETVRSTTFAIESEGNAAVVAEEEEIAGEVAEEMIGIETMAAEDMIAENPDIPDHHRAGATQETEGHSAHLRLENRIHTFLVAAVDADDMSAGDHLHQNRYLLRLSG
jgi:hypothetical protein